MLILLIDTYSVDAAGELERPFMTTESGDIIISNAIPRTAQFSTMLGHWNDACNVSRKPALPSSCLAFCPERVECAERNTISAQVASLNVAQKNFISSHFFHGFNQLKVVKSKDAELLCKKVCFNRASETRCIRCLGDDLAICSESIF